MAHTQDTTPDAGSFNKSEIVTSSNDAVANATPTRVRRNAKRRTTRTRFSGDAPELHSNCRMCGGEIDAVEVGIPHATPAFHKRAGVSAGGMLATAVCRDCAQAINAAWAQQGAPTLRVLVGGRATADAT